MSRTRRAAALAALSAGALAVTARRDARAVAADPSAAELAPLPHGRQVEVTSADGTRLHAEVHGLEGAPTVVLAHGWTCATTFWTPVVRELSRDLRVVLYDQRGHARSGPPGPSGFGTVSLAEDLQAVLEATVPAGEKALLGGHSMGSMTVVAWAGRYPGEVARRASGAFLSSFGVDDLVEQSMVVALPPGWRRARAAVSRVVLTAPLPSSRPSPITRRVVRHVSLSKQATPAQVAFCEQIVLGCPSPTRVGVGRTLGTVALRDSLAHLVVPTTVLVGSADRLTPPVHARSTAADLPRLERLVELPGVGHMAPVEDSASSVAELRHLLAVARTGVPA